MRRWPPRQAGRYRGGGWSRFYCASAAMDGQVQAIRQALDAAGFTDTANNVLLH
ncbi:delta-aminolevulinic acid dehydratase [Salmonella enterica subsp. enterica]|uniref:Delta-aminolevulinic acid dehydratase n=1 Tax=Salmonella enterica I TaxID=59201 RepID=A0A379WDS6_SALET|nr:delta-aminolevulinic acid dehydratase [Salmonella enterica subsp. enterica]